MSLLIVDDGANRDHHMLLKLILAASPDYCLMRWLGRFPGLFSELYRADPGAYNITIDFEYGVISPLILNLGPLKSVTLNLSDHEIDLMKLHVLEAIYASTEQITINALFFYDAKRCFLDYANPTLKELTIRNIFEGSRSQLDLDFLVELVTRCPSIEKLEFGFDSCEIDDYDVIMNHMNINRETLFNTNLPDELFIDADLVTFRGRLLTVAPLIGLKNLKTFTFMNMDGMHTLPDNIDLLSQVENLKLVNDFREINILNFNFGNMTSLKSLDIGTLSHILSVLYIGEAFKGDRLKIKMDFFSNFANDYYAPGMFLNFTRVKNLHLVISTYSKKKFTMSYNAISLDILKTFRRCRTIKTEMLTLEFIAEDWYMNNLDRKAKSKAMLRREKSERMSYAREVCLFKKQFKCELTLIRRNGFT